MNPISMPSTPAGDVRRKYIPKKAEHAISGKRTAGSENATE